MSPAAIQRFDRICVRCLLDRKGKKKGWRRKGIYWYCPVCKKEKEIGLLIFNGYND